VNAEIALLLMLLIMLIGIFSGIHLAFVFGGLGIIFGLIKWGTPVFSLSILSVHQITQNYILTAVPLFVFMGFILERSGIADDLFRVGDLYLRRLRGGLAMATVGGCAVFGMCTGVVAASIVTAGVISLPSMLDRGYDKRLVLGTVGAGGTLGILIPPSVLLIVYASLTSVSAGRLFAGAFTPGFLLAGLYALYIGLRAFINPAIAPLPPDLREKVPLKTYLLQISGVVPVVFIVLAVLGVIIFGIATPTEAAATGAFGAIIIVIAKRRFSLDLIKKASLRTLETIGMVSIIIITSNFFATVFLGFGAEDILLGFIKTLGIGQWGAISLIILIVFVAGMIIDPFAILYMFLSIFLAVADKFGWDPIWFGLIICVCMQTAWLTPPFGYALFFLKGLNVPGINYEDIMAGCIPFIFCQLVGVALCIIFPQIILWLPNLVYG
jgi:tripartite ATP-independent transporter DctM subunit